ncbi:LytR/AlgR family response regulator transcription factor [Flavobacterium sp.]|uniref:LytR/AlgR family response regulator transcription factor n=1 Tax=Flavobacterium sp. TaxID=239 RepID=UPI0039E6F645
MTIKCIIVEDEPLALDVMKGFVTQVPFLELVGVAGDAFAAMELLNTTRVDLMFLDIHLPKLKGLDFLSAIKSPPLVIITSAYHEFAIQSYEHSVLDYLLKPIEFSRFVVAVNKAFDRLNVVVQPVSVSEENQDLFFTVNKKKARIPVNTILYIESQRENVKIVTDHKTIVTRYPISELENELPASVFLRIHRSFIVNRLKIDFIDANDVEIAGKEIPIGRSYKDWVHQTLGIK